ncbi:MAG: amidohydrolase family protein, partial [Acidobacteria bacterium]|nr:amidohydrolase family protein [Acidobacteriota bacterium]
MPLPPPPPPLVQILSGATVWAPSGPVQGQAVALRKGRILAVGPAATLLRAHPNATRIALPGGTLLPGLVEGHAHVESLGALDRQVDLAGVRSLKEAQERIRAWGRDHAEGWVLGRGWDQNRWGGR